MSTTNVPSKLAVMFIQTATPALKTRILLPVLAVLNHGSYRAQITPVLSQNVPVEWLAVVNVKSMMKIVSSVIVAREIDNY